MPARGRPTGDPQLKTAARARCLAIVRARRDPCNRCGQPIDYTRHHTHNRPDPWAFVGDELNPRYLGGDPTDPNNVRAAHHRCNAQAGAHITNQRRRTRPRPPHPNQHHAVNQW